jgi:hypothetical protein
MGRQQKNVFKEMERSYGRKRRRNDGRYIRRESQLAESGILGGTFSWQIVCGRNS